MTPVLSHNSKLGWGGTGVSPVNRVRGRRGFTLLELLLALSLLLLLTAMAWPLMQSQIVAAELPESASRIRSLLYMTRSSAMLEHRRHRVRFAPDVQQPLIEIEPDPIIEPGRFVPVLQDWATEPALLSDVQVHRVNPGRPAYMRPVSAEDGAAQDPLAVETPVEETGPATDSTSAKFQAAMSDGLGGQEAEIDERRPVILFEADGSTDWATLIISRTLPTEELPKDQPEAWVVLDGRTGLAIIRDAVTQSQLDDPTFYVQREKLELPDTPTEDLTLNIPTSLGDLPQDAGQEMQQGLVDQSSLIQQGADQLQGADPSALQGALDPSQQLQDPSKNPNQSPDPNTESPQSEEDALAQLEKELANNSDLSEEEKEEIRRSFRESQSSQDQGGTKSPS